MKIFGNIFKKEDVKPISMKLPVDFTIPIAGDIYSIPVLSFPIKMLYDLSLQSDVITTIVRAITDEVFRNGIVIEERFKSKCTKCGAEFEEDIPVCNECGGPTRKADLSEKRRLKDWLENFTNSFDEDFLSVLKQVDDDVNRIDNGYVLLRKEYFYTKDGNLFGFKVKDIIRASPLSMRLMISKYGMGRDKDGMYLYVCPEHRDNLIKKEKQGKYYCDLCGKELLLAWYASADKGKVYFYAKDEVYHIKRWSNTQGYGIPTILPVVTKVLILMKMDRFMLTAYSLQRSPKALLFVRGRTDSFERVWEQLRQKAMENPNMIYPIVVEGEDNSKHIAEYIDFSLKPEEMDWIDVRNEMRKQIGARYGVQPLFQGDLSIGTGLNNEGLQITVTNRTISTSQDVWNRFLDWLTKQLGFMDWKLKLAPNEEKDIKAQIERERMRIENARIMKDLGYEPILIEGEDGIDFMYKKSNTQSNSASINIQSIRQILRDESSKNDINEVEGSPEGRGKRAINQNYEGMPLAKSNNKVKVYVIRSDGVQQSYYVARDKLQSFIAEHKAKGQHVVVEGMDDINEVGVEILRTELENIMNLDFDKTLEYLSDVNPNIALGIALFKEILLKHPDIANTIISDYLGLPFKEIPHYTEIRAIITDEIIEEWLKNMTALFHSKFGNPILSLPNTPEIQSRWLSQQSNGSTKYIHDKPLVWLKIGEFPNSFQSSDCKILFFNDNSALSICKEFEPVSSTPPS